MESQGEMTPEGARAEMERVMLDPSHPHHQGWQEGRKAATDYVEGIYGRIPGADKPGEATEGLQAGPPDTQPGETPEAAEAGARNELILAPLREEWGGEFDARYAAGREAAPDPQMLATPSRW